MSIKIYTYGLPFGPDDDCREKVDEEIWLAHRYQNRLIELERDRRAAFRATLRDVSPEYAAACEAIESLERELAAVRQRISDGNQTARKRTGDDDDRQTVGEIKAGLKDARKRRKTAQKAALEDEDIKARIDELDARAVELEKLYRSERGCYWGTGGLIEDAVKAAKKSSGDPQFVRWRGRGENGRVGVQIQGGMSADELFSNADTRLQIDPVDPRAWDDETPRGERRRLSRTRLRLRIGSEGRTPVWSEWDVIMHRPLPEGAVIKRAWCKRRKVGTRYKWDLQLTLDLGEQEGVEHEAPGTVAGIDIGWRRREDGLRIAYVATDSDHHELLLDNERLAEFDVPRQLRATRQKEFDAFRGLLVDWIEGDLDLPAWFLGELSHLEQWRSPNRMRDFVWRWSRERFAGDEDVFELADVWRRQDRHLLQWEEGHRDRVLKRRRETCRLWAKKLCARFATIVIEDVDLSQLARRAQPEDVDEAPAEARRLRTVAALSEFVSALEMMAPKVGTEIVRAPAEYTTIACHVCGEQCEWDAAAALWHTCEHCGAEWDQDHNAARNLLKIHEGNFAAAAE